MCGGKNIFQIGLVTINNLDEEEVIILCRVPCLNYKRFNDLEWNTENFKPLIEERSIVSWLV